MPNLVLHGSLLLRFGFIDNVKPDAHLFPSFLFSVYLEDAAFYNIVVAEAKQLCDKEILIMRHITKLHVFAVYRNRIGIGGVVGFGYKRKLFTRLKLA